jgi:hypothetical protein
MASASVVLTSDTSGSVTVTVPSGTSIGTTTLTLPTTGGTIQTSGSGYTTNGVAYATSTSALATGSALTFTGTNLGVGTTAPATSLVLATSDSSTIGQQRFARSVDNSYYWEIGRDNQLTGDFLFSNANGGAKTERMRIDASGNLLVGTTNNNPSGRSASSKFVVSQTAGDTSTLQQSSNSYLNIVSYVSTTSGTRYHICFGDGATYGERGVISTNGTGTTYGTNSDYRLKENIAPMTGALSTVAQLKPVTYKWKSNGSDGQGFIAHELQAVVPECVTGEKDEVDADGNPKYQGIDTSFLVATLTSAIQELNTTITSLTERITALEGK